MGYDDAMAHKIAGNTNEDAVADDLAAERGRLASNTNEDALPDDEE